MGHSFLQVLYSGILGIAHSVTSQLKKGSKAPGLEPSSGEGPAAAYHHARPHAPRTFETLCC